MTSSRPPIGAAAATADNDNDTGPFRDRREAGRALGRALADLAADEPIVVALPRGGVPVAYEVALALGAPLDIGLVRKLGSPMQPELGIGAIGEDGRGIVDQDAVRRLGVSREQLQEIIDSELEELRRRADRYRPDTPPLDVDGRTIILVDDGLATGLTALAAARVLRARGALSVILAVPVCPREIEAGVRSAFDGFVCLHSPEPFGGVGRGYDDFTQTTDAEVIELMSSARGPVASDLRSQPAGHGFEVTIPSHDEIELNGTLRIPERANGLVIFAHGSGSSRFSPRNREVAATLNGAGLGTLLFDLLTDREAKDREKVFDIGLLAGRLLDALVWAQHAEEAQGLPIGLFGASTGAAAALKAAAVAGGGVGAVVSRGGRPDLAGEDLARVVSPTLLIVGGADEQVLALNQQASRQLAGMHELEVVEGAGHLFEEPGALDEVARLAAHWFTAHLSEGRVAR